MKYSYDVYIGLIFDCPFYESCETCPFAKIRAELNEEERVEYYMNLSVDERKTIIETHLSCPVRIANTYNSNQDD